MPQVRSIFSPPSGHSAERDLWCLDARNLRGIYDDGRVIAAIAGRQVGLGLLFHGPANVALCRLASLDGQTLFVQGPSETKRDWQLYAWNSGNGTLRRIGPEGIAVP